MLYFVKTPSWVKKLFPRFIWQVQTSERKLYLSFDDGPHPVHTPFVLDELKKYGAKATFFCVGNNVKLFPEIYKRITDEGHSIGNHTFSHLNGKKVSDDIYMKDIAAAASFIGSDLFRPPYGRIRSFQAKMLLEMKRPFRIVMWTVLSGDFDPAVSVKRCLENVVLNADKGAIVVFHDSEKAAIKLKAVLPQVLENFSKRGFLFEKITEQQLA